VAPNLHPPLDICFTMIYKISTLFCTFRVIPGSVFCYGDGCCDFFVWPGQATSAFRDVQLQGLGARGHKPSNPKRQRAPFQVTRLMLVAPGQAPSAFRDVQLQGLEARGHKPAPPKRQRAPFWWGRLMLVASGQSPSAFRNVQLRRLAPRGHKSRPPKRQRAPFRRSRLMLVGPAQAASAFRDIQLQGLGLEVISQVTQKGKERLFRLLVLCLSPQGKPLPLFDYDSVFKKIFFF